MGFVILVRFIPRRPYMVLNKLELFGTVGLMNIFKALDLLKVQVKLHYMLMERILTQI